MDLVWTWYGPGIDPGIDLTFAQRTGALCGIPVLACEHRESAEAAVSGKQQRIACARQRLGKPRI
jgi:hypothetical protein